METVHQYSDAEAALSQVSQVTYGGSRADRCRRLTYGGYTADIQLTYYLFFLYLLHLFPGFYSYTEVATWKILDLLTETLLI